MARVISVVNQKGGVGKTTTSVNLSAYLAHLGKSVLLVDLDPQGNASSGLGIDFKSLTNGLYEVITGPYNLADIIHPTAHDNLHLAPANQNLAAANIELVSHDDREFKLHNNIKDVRSRYDYIIIDSPPSLGILTINGLVAADEVLIPVQCEYYALEGLSQLLNTINLVKENLKPELKVLGALMTMYDDKHKLTQEIFDELYRYFPNRIFRTVIPRNIRLAEAPSFGRSILHYDRKSTGAKAYEKLAKEIILLENYSN
ncbi:MAG: Chromosome segregation ATPase [Candidatus Kuenenbacteria bacterium GW2011_GWA2_42_15]|nr:MAG: Chromosome segregation ATPase [Candidatus Kuenenbacteria bacterium GW2011_GWA2_42_15]